MKSNSRISALYLYKMFMNTNSGTSRSASGWHLLVAARWDYDLLFGAIRFSCLWLYACPQHLLFWLSTWPSMAERSNQYLAWAAPWKMFLIGWCTSLTQIPNLMLPSLIDLEDACSHLAEHYSSSQISTTAATLGVVILATLPSSALLCQGSALWCLLLCYLPSCHQGDS